MTSSTAQDEFDHFLAKNTASAPSRHPQDSASDSETAASSSPRRSDDEQERGNGAGRGIRGANALTRARGTLDSEDSDDDLEDRGLEGNASNAGNMKTSARYFLPSRHQHNGANTGPKGVIADAYAFEHARKKRSSLTAPVRRAASGAAAAIDGDGDAEGLDGSDEDDFIRQWQQSRLQELRDQEGKRRASPPGGKRWGTLQTVDGEGYLDAVERSGRDVTVLVLIYDDNSDVSNIIEQLIRQLARANTSARFVRLHYEEAEMEGAGVPALLAYRNGDKFAGLVPLVDELPDDAELSAETLQVLLQRHQML